MLQIDAKRLARSSVLRRFAALVLVQLALAGCTSTSSSDPPFPTVIAGLQQLPVQAGLRAEYSGPGTARISLNLEDAYSAPGDAGLVVPAMRLRATRSTQSTTMSYFIVLDSATGAVLGSESHSQAKDQGGQVLFQRNYSLRFQLTDQLLSLGFQIKAGASTGMVGNQLVSFDTHSSTMQVPVTYNIANGSSGLRTRHHTAEMWVRFDARSPFPAAFRDAFDLVYTRTESALGQGPVVFPKGNRTGQPLRVPAAVPWTGPMPPESDPSGLEFPLRDAWASAQSNRDVSNFMASNREARLCSAEYIVTRALVPPDQFQWGMTLCAPGGTRLSFSVVRHGTTKMFPDEVLNVQPLRGESLARSLLPARTVPIDGLFIAYAERACAPGTRENLSLSIDISAWQPEVEFLGTNDPALDRYAFSEIYATKAFVSLSLREGNPIHWLHAPGAAWAGPPC